MKTIGTILLLSFLSCCSFGEDKAAISAALAGCGPQGKKFDVNTDGSQHPAPTPEEGKAVIYFIADGHLSNVFGVDGKWVGAVNGGGYFFVPIEPGEHHLCAKKLSFLPPGGGVSVHSLKAEPGGSYYFRTRMYQIISSGTGWTLQLDQMDSDEGRWFVSWSKFSTSHPKD